MDQEVFYNSEDKFLEVSPLPKSMMLTFFLSKNIQPIIEKENHKCFNFDALDEKEKYEALYKSHFWISSELGQLVLENEEDLQEFNNQLGSKLETDTKLAQFLTKSNKYQNAINVLDKSIVSVLEFREKLFEENKTL